MNDKQMLELAAKAAGYWDKDCRWLKNGQGGESLYWWDVSLPGGVNKNVRFDPLTDDGDAFRLGVKLHLFKITQKAHWLIDDKTDFYAANRLAIVRAAAEIGRAL